MAGKKTRLDAISYMRGISMLGVIGIHVGSQYLANPSPNLVLVSLFEVATRFSVPIFFFISAFGLFYGLDMNAPFDYGAFLLRRAKTVLVPYLFWSVFYILHYTVVFRDTVILHFKTLANYFFFGFGSYQLYFMVILLWFYLLMPLWIRILKKITPRGLFFLFIFQVAFDYWSSYLFSAASLPEGVLRALAANRLNYWVVHYVFIFLLGGWIAGRYDKFLRFARSRMRLLTGGFLGSLALLTGFYFYLIHVKGYDAVGAVNTAHQLSPPGIFYTVAASVFFLAFFSTDIFGGAGKFLDFLGRHSYFVYLVHPLAITYIGFSVAGARLVMTAPLAIAFYFAVVGLSLAAAVLVRRAGERCPWINRLTIGMW